MPGLSVSALMSTPLISIPPTMRVPQMKRCMQQQHIRRLPVVEGEHLLGIMSLDDIQNALSSDATSPNIYELTQLLYHVTAHDLMRKPVITADADEPWLAAARRMLQHSVSGLPVLRAGRLVGMLTEHDIFRALITGQLGCLELTAGVPPDAQRAHAVDLVDRLTEDDQSCPR
ncbi:MAG: hypothetical protein NVSMB42_02560 [Herpetosiphon sp.]